MKLVCLYFRDNNEKVTEFVTGAYVLGRGSRLKCHNIKVSRNHAVLHVTTEKVTITPNHVNPCFYKSADGTNLTILKHNEPFEVKDGDEIGFLPDEFWYKIELKNMDLKSIKSEEKVEHLTQPFNCDKESENHNEDPILLNSTLVNVEAHSTTNSSKRIRTEDELETNKKFKTNDMTQMEQEADSSIAQRSTVEKDKVENKNLVSDSESTDTSTTPLILKQELIINSAVETKDTNILNSEENSTVNQNTTRSPESEGIDNNQPSSSTAQGTATTSTRSQPRDRCWYGTSCYRKNPQHKSELSHPGDSDYDSDDNDKRPACPYGTSCYRRNKSHRDQFRHPKTQGIPKRPSQMNPPIFQFHNCNFYGTSPFS